MPATPPAAITIRPATEADLPAVKYIADRDKLALGFVSSGTIRAAIGRGFVYVAERHGHIVGYCEFWRFKDGSQVTIYSIAVAAEHRHQGIGRKLIDAVAALAPVVLLKCTADNPANGFYKRLGFQKVRIEEPKGKRRTLNVWERDADALYCDCPHCKNDPIGVPAGACHGCGDSISDWLEQDPTPTLCNICLSDDDDDLDETADWREPGEAL